MDKSTEVANLFSSVTMGAVLGFIFYFIVETVGVPEFGRFELGLPQLIVVGAGLGIVFYLFGKMGR